MKHLPQQSRPCHAVQDHRPHQVPTTPKAVAVDVAVDVAMARQLSLHQMLQVRANAAVAVGAVAVGAVGAVAVGPMVIVAGAAASVCLARSHQPRWG